MKVLAVYSIKGGVGKTATAVNLAYLAAGAGRRTLLWDLDPQGASSFYLRIRAEVAKPRKMLRGKRPLAGAVKGSDYEGLDLLPADPAYRRMDIRLDEAKKPTVQLRRLVEQLEGDYELLILDCPPSLTLVWENVFRAVDAMLVPVIPTPLSLRTLHQLLDFLAEEGLGDVPVWPFYALADRRKRLHQEISRRPSSREGRCPSSWTTRPNRAANPRDRQQGRSSWPPSIKPVTKLRRKRHSFHATAFSSSA